MSKCVGPRLTDREFFMECLDYEVPGLEKVKSSAECGDYPSARKFFAQHIRESLKAEVFFTIAFEKAENTYTYPNEDEIDAAERISKNILISCGIAHEFGETVDWFANPTYNKYREWTWQLNRHNDWKLLAHVYRKTGDEKYAEACARLFKSWVKQAVCPDKDVRGFETICWRTIECGIRMGANWPYVLHAFYRSKSFTDDIITDWYKSIVEHGRRLRSQHMSGNWLIMEMNGLAHIGILYPELKEGKEWLSYAIKVLREELTRQIYPDGFQYELTTGYHDVVLNNYQRFFRTAKAYGVEFPDELLTTLEGMALINVMLMQPDGRLPDINDGSRAMVAEILAPKLEMFPDNQHIKWMVTGGREGKIPEYTSIALPYAGLAVMRTGWTASDSWVLFDGGPFGKAHQHEDKLTILFFTDGKLILTEAGNYAYDNSEMRKYVLSTRGHNTIRINGMDQNRRTGYTFAEDDIRKKAGISYNFSSEVDYAEACYDEGYGEKQEKLARHTRSVYFIKKPTYNLKPFLIIVDRLESEEERDYEVIWHFDTDEVRIIHGEMEQGGAKAKMEELTVFISPEDIELDIVSGQKEPEWQGFIANSGIQGDYRAIPTLLAKKKAADIRLVTILIPNVNGECAVDRIEASNCIKDTNIALYFSSGQVWKLDEEILRGR